MVVRSVFSISRRNVLTLVTCVLNAATETHVKAHDRCLNSSARVCCRAMKLHQKARDVFYAGTNEGIVRFSVPDDKVDWSVKWNDYSPAVYTSDKIVGQPWADPEIGDSSFKPKWNELDKDVDRKSFEGKYELVDGYPRNPMGRTGLEGRGRLGRWGPNHAADPIVTRWKRKDNEVVKSPTGSQVLQFVAIQRSDTKEWALPGGMVDAGEKISATLQREFGEEALNSLELSSEEKVSLHAMLDDFFQKGEELYKGYVDDPRNTDNAWMETVAVNFHDDTGETVGKFPLTAGDDAMNVRWTDLHSGLDLYASHADFLEMSAKLLKAHW